MQCAFITANLSVTLNAENVARRKSRVNRAEDCATLLGKIRAH